MLDSSMVTGQNLICKLQLLFLSVLGLVKTFSDIVSRIPACRFERIPQRFQFTVFLITVFRSLLTIGHYCFSLFDLIIDPPSGLGIFFT